MGWAAHSLQELGWIALSVLLLGMAKGGFPVGSIALPMLVLIWPREDQAARGAVSFMLPVLCTMDVFAVAFYRRHIRWRRLRPVWPGMLGGVLLGSALFVAGEQSFLAISDRGLKLAIGATGLSFVGLRAARSWLLRRLEGAAQATPLRGTLFGFGAGVTSTMAHAAGPLMQMYLLPQKLPKLSFAGTAAAFFFVLNLVKMVPFIAFGRIRAPNLMLALFMLPLIPAGVAAGYLAVRLTRPKHYVALIYTVLFLTSCLLVWKAVRGG